MDCRGFLDYRSKVCIYCEVPIKGKNWCVDCWNRKEQEEMVIYECFNRMGEVTSKECKACFDKKEQPEDMRTRAQCVEEYAQKIDGDIF